MNIILAGFNKAVLIMHADVTGARLQCRKEEEERDFWDSSREALRWRVGEIRPTPVNKTPDVIYSIVPDSFCDHNLTVSNWPFYMVSNSHLKTTGSCECQHYRQKFLTNRQHPFLTTSYNTSTHAWKGNINFSSFSLSQQHPQKNGTWRSVRNPPEQQEIELRRRQETTDWGMCLQA